MSLCAENDCDNTLSLNNWTSYKKTPTCSILNNEEALFFTPSSVDTYLKCPRRFFYRHILQLKEAKKTHQALLGSVIHKILEVFNRCYQEEYTFKKLMELKEQFFQTDHDLPDSKITAFSDYDRSYIKSVPKLQLHQLEQQVQAAFYNLQSDGYFDIPFKALWVEEKLELDSSKGIKGIHLQGRVDLIRQKTDNCIEIIDYKTSRQKYSSSKRETNMRSLFKALEPVDWDEDESQRYEGRDYQLPLYWLMLLSDNRFIDYRADLTIQLVQPLENQVKKDTALTLTHEELCNGKQNILEMLQKGIIEPIRSRGVFLPLGKPLQDCKTCSYINICDGSGQEEESDL